MQADLRATDQPRTPNSTSTAGNWASTAASGRARAAWKGASPSPRSPSGSQAAAPGRDPFPTALRSSRWAQRGSAGQPPRQGRRLRCARAGRRVRWPRTRAAATQAAARVVDTTRGRNRVSVVSYLPRTTAAPAWAAVTASSGA